MVINSLNQETLGDILLEIARIMKLDIAAIKSQVEDVLKSKITYLPVRHHSPGSAILIQKVIKQKKPKLVLIEGPSSADSLIHHLIHKGTSPPIALLSIFSDINNHFKLNGILSPDVTIPSKFQVYYPFAEYSPELVAMKTAKNIPVHFIDLPLTGFIPYLVGKENAIYRHITEKDEIQIVSSSFYQKLVEVFDFKDFNETWETLFELGTNQKSIQLLQRNMLTFCACLRSTIPNKILDLDGTTERESYMRYKIEELMKKYHTKEKDVLVITGGLHSVTLKSTPAKSPSPNVTVSGQLDSIIPFSYKRLSSNSSYGAGNEGPQYYNEVWRKFKQKHPQPFKETALEMIMGILKDARSKEQLVSIADSIAAYNGAQNLAGLRRRTEPCLRDITDAIYMTIVKGDSKVDGHYLEEIINQRIIGSHVGRVTDKIGRLPLQIDFYLQLETLGIEIEDKGKNIILDLRNDVDQVKSQILWRIKYLDIGLLQYISGPNVLTGKTGIFKEKWMFSWSPQIDSRLIELNLYGSTVEEASKSKLIEETQKSIKNFEEISKLYYSSVLMGFKTYTEKMNKTCEDALEVDDNFIQLSNGFSNILMIYQYISALKLYEKLISPLKQLIRRAYFQACYSIPNYSNPKEDIIVPLVNNMRNMANLLINYLPIPLDQNAFISSLDYMVQNTSTSFIRGSGFGIEHLLNVKSVKNIEQELANYLQSTSNIQMQTGEFIRGLIYVCHAKILFNDEILLILIDIVSSLDLDVFTSILPSMRKAFAELEQREYEIFVEKLAEMYGLRQSKFVEKEIEEVKDEYVVLFSQVDKKVRSIYEEWFGSLK